MACSSNSSCGTSSPKCEFSDSDSDQKQRGQSSRPRRLPTSNSKNAVAARMNRMKQKQYVKKLEKKLWMLKREYRDVKSELNEQEKKCASSLREVAYLRKMIANSHQIGSLLRNIRWRNIFPQGSNVDKTLNELNSEASVESFPITASTSLFDDSFDLLEERNYSRPVNFPRPAREIGEDWAFDDDDNDQSAEQFQSTVPSKLEPECMKLP